MKHILLLSIAMIFAAPAWAAEVAAATAEKPAAQAAAPAEAPKKVHKSHKPHAHKQVTAAENMQVRPVAAAADAQTAQAVPKHVPAAPILAAPTPATLTCSSGCGPQTCGGAQVCAHNKPYPACSTPCP